MKMNTKRESKHPVDWDAARERLHALTADPAIIDGFERIRRTDDLDDAFIEAFYGAGLSLDWVLLGKGGPLAGAEGVANA
jgi:hypothetical protein